MKCSLKGLIKRVDTKYPFTLIDVGALDGIPLKWRVLNDCIKAIAFEPDPREFCKLESSKNKKYYNYALHNVSSDLKYFIANGRGLSSILKPNLSILSEYMDSERFEVAKEEIIQSDRVKNLDAVIKEGDVKDVDFIKLDTQGSELAILHGGQDRLIPNIFGAQVEVEFIEMYEKQPLFRDVDKFMSEKGFQLIDLRRQYWKRSCCNDYKGKGQLVFGDALYFKKINILISELSNVQDSLYRRSKVIKSIVTCLVYKMYDYAVLLLKSSCEHGYIDEREYVELHSIIESHSKKGLFGKYYLDCKMYNRLLSVLNIFGPRSYLGWADSDICIANVKDN